jgi:hypothetical protein
MYCNSPAYNHQPLAEVSFFKTRPTFHHTFTKSSALLAECQPLLPSIHPETPILLLQKLQLEVRRKLDKEVILTQSNHCCAFGLTPATEPASDRH